MKMSGMSPEIIDYLVKRGCVVDELFILIPHRCQHLRVDLKLSKFDVDPTGERKLVEPKYSCDIHYKEEYPLICRRFQGHGRYYIPEGCVYLDQKEDTTKESKSLIRNIKSVRDHEKGSI
jgi:hypothetical protein